MSAGPNDDAKGEAPKAATPETPVVIDPAPGELEPVLDAILAEALPRLRGRLRRDHDL